MRCSPACSLRRCSTVTLSSGSFLDASELVPSRLGLNLRMGQMLKKSQFLSGWDLARRSSSDLTPSGCWLWCFERPAELSPYSWRYFCYQLKSFLFEKLSHSFWASSIGSAELAECPFAAPAGYCSLWSKRADFLRYFLFCFPLEGDCWGH